MGIFSIFRRAEPEASRPHAVSAMAGESAMFGGFGDPAFYEFIRSGGGSETASGASVSPKSAMRNTTVLRSVSLISGSIGMLPLHLRRQEDKKTAREHPLFRLLHRKPNAWQTAFEFRSLMQQRVLLHGDAYARIVWSRGRPIALVPLEPSAMEVKQRADWSLEYRYTPKGGGAVSIDARDVFHLRGQLSDDGVKGLSLVKLAAEAIGLAQQGEKAAARLFRNGMLVGGALKHPGNLSPEAYGRLKASMEEGQGADNAGKWKILEEGMDLVPGGNSGRDSQALETRQHQNEEIARTFGVPRPLLMLDGTNWGTGVDVLGQFFVRYGLNPWFTAWEQAIERDLLQESEADVYEAKFNPGGLLRGSINDQAEFFAKALGSGGHQPWMGWEEVRELSDLPTLDEAPAPGPGLSGTGGGNEPA